jgi:hypothetical protein
VRWIVVSIFVGILVVAGFAAWRAYEVNAAYNLAVTRIDHLRALSSTDPAALSADSLVQARTDLQDLGAQLARIDSATSLLVGESVVSRLPWIGTRYAAARGLVHVGLLAVDAGMTVTDVGVDLLRALDTGGFSKATPGAPTWLDLLAPRQAELAIAARNIKSMQSIRATIDEQVLPDRIRTRLAELDRMLQRPEVDVLTSVDFPAVRTGLGGGAQATYLVVFQNPAELRPTGGFPGTMALVTLDRGQLGSYQFFDGHELTDAYIAHRSKVLPQPWPIERFFPQQGFLLHDALWWPDFPRSARQLMSMYAETGWPAIDGVIAVQPEVASTLVGVTGPFTVEFAGQQRRITPDNVYTEINRQRVQDVETREDLLVHKEMLGLIGKNLIERLKNADRRALASALQQFGVACQRRDLQVYTADPSVEAELDRQHCTGRLQPVEGEPTLAVTYANLALSKSSLDMRPRLMLTASSVEDGQRQMRLDIDLRNGAVAEEDPTYAGFQRWWVEVGLPDGSTLLSERGPMEDPDAPNGGSYLADLFPNITGRITVRFSMPDAPSLLIRHQPGVRPGDVVVSQINCQPLPTTESDRDLLIDLSALCGG